MYAQFYDLNIWSQHPGELNLTAYQWEQVPFSNDLQTNTERSHTVKFHARRDLLEVEFLLNDLWINHHPLTDYDTWVDLDEVLNDKTPARIQEFLAGLPNYDVPKIAL